MSLAAQPIADHRVRVMIVDDSAVVRGLTRRWLEAERGIEIAKVCSDGEQAVREIGSVKPDVLILDIEMPKLDGLSALPLLRKASPATRIVMASTLTSRGAAASIKALTLGAADCIGKPEASGLGSADAYRRELIEKVLALGAPRPTRPRTDLKLRTNAVKADRPQALVVAASTGGPQALEAFLKPIARRIEAPIFIVQHMPATFMPIFAARLGDAVGKPCREAEADEVVIDNRIYMAPGDYHMRLVRAGAGWVIKLDRSAPVNFCRPAADPLFESAADAYGARLLGVVLTGMGHDGTIGAERIVGAGGRVIVQDEASSVVWGMPGSVALAGYAEAVKPLTELSSMTLSLMNGDRT